MLLLKISILVLLAIWLLAILFAYDYGRIGRLMQKQDCHAAVGDHLPPLSIVITAHNQAQALRRHLPAILSQDYDRFEVVVVNMSSTDETLDVLERLELQYANLRHTYTPSSARDISLDRLALTLGIRSSLYDWVVLTHPDCEPATSQWLTRIGETIAHPRNGVQSKRLTEPDMVIGFARYERQRTTLFDRRVDFFRLWNDITAINHVLTGHAAMRADGCNMAFRKAYFMEQGGFSAHQNLKAGAEELLVNYTSTPSNTALMLTPSAMVLQDGLPARRLWKQQRVFYAETRRYQHHRWLFRFTQALRMLLPWLLIFGVVAMVGILIATSLDPPPGSAASLSEEPSTLTIGILTVALLLFYIIFKITNFNRTARQLESPRYYLALLLYELRLPLWNLSAAITHHFASKNEFRKKFI